MEAYPSVPVRVGGSGAGMHLLLGNWAELGEQLIPIDMYVCSRCGRMEMFATQEARNKLAEAAEGD